jgi:hypothetical protein
MWHGHLLAGVGGDADPKSDMGFGELEEWAIATFKDVEGEPCGLMARGVAEYIEALDSSDSHHPLNDVVWRLTMNAVEGHAGWNTALNQYLAEWRETAKGKRDLGEMQGEVLRTIDGALAKAKAKFDARQRYMPDDKCAGGVGDTDAWTRRLVEAEAEAEVEFVPGRMYQPQYRPSYKPTCQRAYRRCY